MESLIVAKVVILGRTNSGKTCLLERYLHGRYVETLEATIGAAYGTRTVQVLDRRVSLGIWDTAGSERYDAMSRVYYRGAKAAVICYDLSNEYSFFKAKYWINELQMYEELCKIYLCGTKADIVQNKKSARRVLASDVASYAEEINAKVFETSSKTGYGVEAIFYAVAEGCVKDDSNTDEKDKNGVCKLGKTPIKKEFQCCG